MTQAVQQERKPALPTWARIVLFIIAFLILSAIFQIVGLLVAKIPLSEAANIISMGTEVLLVLQLWSLVPLAILVYVFRKFIDRKSIVSLGFSVKNRGKDFAVGLLIAVLLIGGGSLVLSILGMVEFSLLKIDLGALVISFLLFIVVALNEEIMVRGYILNNLMSSTNKYLALIISAVIFTAMHGLNSNISLVPIINLFLAGIILGSAYIFTKNLWFPISLHLFWNFFQGPVLGYHVSGQETESVFAIKLSGSEMLNGGGFGFEGSLVCTIMSVLVIGAILFYYLRKPAQL
jgi:uncharacterized protein